MTDTPDDKNKDNNDDPLALKLQAEVDEASWAILEPHYDRGALVFIDPKLDLITVAMRVIRDEVDSVKEWTDQKWRTKSGKRSSDTGERYLPSAAIKALSPAEYAATTKAKRAGKATGKQFVSQPKRIAKKTARFR